MVTDLLHITEVDAIESLDVLIPRLLDSAGDDTSEDRNEAQD